MDNEYLKAAEKINDLIGNCSEHQNVVDVLKVGYCKIIDLAKTKSIIKIASKK